MENQKPSSEATTEATNGCRIRVVYALKVSLWSVWLDFEVIELF